ncbi:pyridoxamine 5'-phosphate oxidase family protein [Flexivirga oryzae]|uniref:Nitroimidazol reductase NimA-like FMN-containing flavoprotein (Pyridoxamine 5'-phosphate oxidase superfamily) n=1 Tax=Flexivirga oryzae TaxID=1794944 RepID=A0A839N7K9_9MICO|nr:pyridoxamine 5'-phosphate oxidase family protein [Flexivirga oryzae]MBB2892739.1 nitroimidazol reductase NimA-like FMN-containing flavoprotein (pyridoxamine 5'-phosphate oxidase superfamily) [Flexivirga oryzae]
MSFTNRDTVELPTDECWELTRSVRVGRLAVIVDGKPDIFPVNHLVDDETIVIRTGSGTKHSAADRQPVAFEVDGYDLQHAVAWSVVIKGTARSIERVHELVEALQLPVFPWQHGAKPRFLRIEPQTITGRRITVSSSDLYRDPAE